MVNPWRSIKSIKKKLYHESSKAKRRWKDPIKSHKTQEERTHYYLEVTFGESGEEGVVYLHDNPLVVTIKIATKWVARILVDTGSSSDILYREAFEKMDMGK